VHRPDDRLPHGLHVDGDLLDLVDEPADVRDSVVALGRLLEIVAGAEGAAFAREDDHPHLGVGRRCLQRFVKIPHELGDHGVQAVRAVELDVRHPAPSFVDDRLQLHGVLQVPQNRVR